MNLINIRYLAVIVKHQKITRDELCDIFPDNVPLLSTVLSFLIRRKLIGIESAKTRSDQPIYYATKLGREFIEPLCMTVVGVLEEHE